MISKEKIHSIPKSDLQDAAKTLEKEDVSQLVDWLSLKDDNLRYQAFLLLRSRSMFFDDVYPYWDTFRDKLTSDNSYQRSIGIMLIAENVRWDAQNRIESAVDECLALLNDEKPVTVRQCIQSLGKVALLKPEFSKKIADRLMMFDYMAVKETMCKPVLLDIINVLLAIRKVRKTEGAEQFIQNALSGEILDLKSKKQIKLELAR